LLGGKHNQLLHFLKDRRKLPLDGSRQRKSVDSDCARPAQGDCALSHRRARRKDVVHKQQPPPCHQPGVRLEFPHYVIGPFKSCQTDLGFGCPEPLDSAIQHGGTRSDRKTCSQQCGLIVSSFQQPVSVQWDRHNSIHPSQYGRPGSRRDQGSQIARQDRSQFQSAVILESMDCWLKRPFVQCRHAYTSQRIPASGARRPEPFHISWQLNATSLAYLPRRRRPHSLRTRVAEPLAASHAVYATGRENQVEQVGTESLKQFEDGLIAMTTLSGRQATRARRVSMAVQMTTLLLPGTSVGVRH